VAIHLSLDVVDGISQDVMRGFGAVPRRGAEVGGILTGNSAGGKQLLVHVDGYQLVPIEYRFGPSYLLSDADHDAFQEGLERLRASGAKPVGFFRSQTREATGLGAEDLDLIDRYFPDPSTIVLLIQPFATRVSKAGFYFREGRQFQSGPPLAEFNFRRKDLGGGDPVRRASFPPAAVEAAAPARSRVQPAPLPVDSPAEALEEERQGALKTRPRGGWVWLPLSFIFLLLGVLLGFQAALTLRPQTPAADPFAVGLTVARESDNLNVRWDRQAPAIRTAVQGLLVIEDGGASRRVSLSADQLQTGSVVYPHTAGEVRFRLELTLKSGAVLVQKLGWKE
jgi:hypothetical protein